MGDFDWGFDFDFGEPKTEKVVREKPKREFKNASVACIALSPKYLYRRAFTELKLIDVSEDINFKEGICVNYLTGGDVDQLSYLRLMLRKVKHLAHLIISTWCASAEDLFWLFSLVKDGIVDKMDVYVGEIFPSSYKVEYKMLRDFYAEHPDVGRYAIFRNHSKIIAGTDGGGYSFSVQTSANANTNPRHEQGCIQISHESYMFYKEYYDKIVSYDKE